LDDPSRFPKPCAGFESSRGHHKRPAKRANLGLNRKPKNNYDDFAELVAQRIETTNGRISSKRQLPAARAAGYVGFARNLRRLVAEAKTAWRGEHHRVFRPAIWAPGDVLAIDWGAEGGLQVFCAVLAWCFTGLFACRC